MGDAMVVNVEEPKNLEKPEKKVVKLNKRKRESIALEGLSQESKGSMIDELKKELEDLFKYFKEVSSGKDEVLEELSGSCSSINSVIACLLEESSLPYSKLVEKVFEKVKTREGVTLVSVKSSVLLVGQRSIYGIADANADADVLEDSSEKCLWCWETRDMKLLPKTQRALLNIRRTCRQKIHDRISAVSAMIAALQLLESHPNRKTDLVKASDKLVKTLREADIRQVMGSMMQKSETEFAEKEAKLKEKELVKELERNKRELEKEKKRMDREHLKEKLQREKEQKRLQDEAEKEEKLREAEKKQSKKQQEEAEKEQRRREKEEAQQKQQLSIKKQATLMEKFLKSAATKSALQDNVASAKAVISDSPTKEDRETSNAVTLTMDSAFSLKKDTDATELYRLHRDTWNRSGRSIRSGDSRRWGLRRKPKTTLIKELKLQASSSETDVSDKVATPNKSVPVDALTEKVGDQWVDNIPDERLCNSSGDSSLAYLQISNRTKKLLQFDKSHRPAYYGTLSAKSDVIGPRHPLTKDPNLDYEVDSDEEWEEEDPGESLSDCEKDEEEDILVEGSIKADDEDGSEDGFLVPDGYLSDNEGVQIDSMDTDEEDDTRSSPQSKQDIESEEFRALYRQQKYINNITEHTLQKNQPLIIYNLMHEKNTLCVEDLNGSMKLEQLFLQALSLKPFLGGSPIEMISDEKTTGDEDQNQDVVVQQSPVTPVSSVDLLEKDLSKVVSCIQSCGSGISKVVESLQQSFPGVPKTQLRIKVREVAEFVDNRWKVKKTVLDKLGFTISPVVAAKSSSSSSSEKRKRGTTVKSIATFFSKRCLPPTDGSPLKTADENSSPQQQKINCSENRQPEIHRMDLS